MTQAYTILLDSLRMLRASKLFWVSLWISAVVAVAYASIGFNDKGMTVMFGLWDFEIEIMRKGTAESQAFYTLIFTDVIVRFWLGWASLVLALISTCSIFPQFLQTGSVELAISKPVTRARLFLLKYIGGLLFVAVQTLLFTIVCFIALGVRCSEWNLSVFWAVPVVTFSFSLIYCIGVFVGVWSRSTIFALFASLLFWLMTLIVQWVDDFTYKMGYTIPEMGVNIDMRTGQVSDGTEDAGAGFRKFHQKIQPLVTIMPKTRETILSLKRLIVFEERDSMLAGVDLGSVFAGGEMDPNAKDAMKKYDLRYSWFSIVGTSLIFELVVLGGAMLLFSRRDY